MPQILCVVGLSLSIGLIQNESENEDVVIPGVLHKDEIWEDAWGSLLSLS